MEDDVLIARSFEHALEPIGHVLVAYSVAEARAAVRLSKPPTALFVDLHLPDGCGLDLADDIRRAGLQVPVLVITGDPQPELINRAHDLGAELIVKPPGTVRIRAFAKRALAALGRPSSDVATIWQGEYRLTAAETLILRASLRGTPRDSLPATLRITPSTVKTHINNLLSKTGDSTLAAAVQRALREAMRRRDESPP